MCLYVKGDKCEFHIPTISFLDYVIGQKGVSMDTTKVATIMEWIKPKMLKERQHFLGFANFYQQLIHGSSSITTQLMTLLRGGPKHLKWNQAATEAFNKFKEAFTFTPFLQHPNPIKLFIVEMPLNQEWEQCYPNVLVKNLSSTL